MSAKLAPEGHVNTMNTTTRILAVAIAILAFAAPANGEPTSDDGGGIGTNDGSCVTLDGQGTPPVIVDPDACAPIHDSP